MSSFIKFTSSSRRSAGALLLAGVIAGVTVGGGVGVFAAPTSNTVTVCANKTTYVLRYAKSGKCAKTETSVVLNQTGPEGEAGNTGKAGATGKTGATGAKGDTGATGATGAKGDTGATGTAGATGAKGESGDAGASAPVTTGTNCVATKCTYQIGDTGPGGGFIFFVDYNDEYATYNYLEAAPTDGVFAEGATGGTWSTDNSTIYSETGVNRVTIKGLHRGLFGGKAATAAIVTLLDTRQVPKNLYAAGVADDYEVNQKSDWWLPSITELQKMQENLINKGIGGFAAGPGYWSSSESDDQYAWVQVISSGRQDYNGYKNNTLYYSLNVRPVRGF